MKSGLARLSLHAALFLAAPLIAAGSARAAEHVKLCAVRSFGGGPTMVALDKGFFAAQGLDAELVMFDSAQPIAVAVASGDCDFGAAGMTAAFFNFAAQGTLKIIAAGTWEHEGFQSIGFLISNQAYDAGLKGFKDFGGHSVGITQRGSPLDHDLGRVLEKYNVPLAGIRILPLQSNQNVASALIGGQADAAVQTAANAYALVNKGQAHLLGWVSDELPMAQSEGTFTTTKMANDHPDIVKRFMAAFRKASATWDAAFTDAAGKRADQTSAPEIVAIAAKYVGQPESVIKLGINYFDPQSRIRMADIQEPIDWFTGQGMMKPGIKAEQLVDKRYVIEAP
jgi:NitT/TauT family transport system substrate-binding protein